MSPTQPPASSNVPEVMEQATTKVTARKRIFQILLVVSLVIIIFTAWQLLNNRINNTDPTVAGRPLSNPQTHLHTMALGGQPGVLYLGTHYGLFTSNDSGHTWPQRRGALNTLMITSIAVSPANPRVLAVIGRPTTGFGSQTGIYFSSDGGNTWKIGVPSGLSPSAYLFTVQAGSGSAGHFYAFYVFAGWFETQDMGTHWRPITSGTLSNMQTPSLLTDPADANFLLLGGDQGLYESRDDGSHWNQITAVRGSVLSLRASNTPPRRIFCTTDQGFYSWRDGNTQITRIANLPMSTPPTRLVANANANILYGLVGQDLWYSANGGATWQHRWHFDRGDLISLLVDPLDSNHLYAGFFLPAKAIYSADGGNSWQTLTA